jgi:hypothetical protein
MAAMTAGRCDAYANDGSSLAAVRATLPNGRDYRVLQERLSKEPYSAFVRQGDELWFSIVRWYTNAMIEAERVTQVAETPELVDTPSASGRGQVIARCPRCKVAVWSNYSGAGPLIRFVRVGTLDNPDALPPDIHIFTASKQPWVVLPPGTPAVAEYYDRERYWPAESLARRRLLLSSAGKN